MMCFRLFACLAVGLFVAGIGMSPRPVMAAEGEPVLERCIVSLVEEAEVPAREAGVLLELQIREGDVVSRGDLIARIDDSQPDFDRRKAVAEHAQAQAKAESDVDVRYAVAAEQVAKAEYDKANESNNRVPGSVTRVELDRLQLTWKRGELQIEQAQVERKLATMAVQSQEVDIAAAEDAINRRKILAPLDGVVVRVYPHLGEWMQPGDPLARVVRADRLRVEGFVDAARFDPDKVRDRPVTVEVTLADERVETFKGRIVFTSPIVESGGEYLVWAEVENRQLEAGHPEEWMLRPGQTVQMTIHSQQKPLAPVRRTRTETASR
ncbi:MAG: HlyD family efflux transporter periplasmic adaptor subunit [Pirellulales bacterium]|jgi:multidrug efflux pump subunit AcrA (membrane-fusion protein)|nr:HlyD family efflux transporter periplasmic adaptor subunit [Pirellulales bacterium]